MFGSTSTDSTKKRGLEPSAASASSPSFSVELPLQQELHHRSSSSSRKTNLSPTIRSITGRTSTTTTGTKRCCCEFIGMVGTEMSKRFRSSSSAGAVTTRRRRNSTMIIACCSFMVFLWGQWYSWQLHSNNSSSATTISSISSKTRISRTGQHQQQQSKNRNDAKSTRMSTKYNSTSSNTTATSRLSSSSHPGTNSNTNTRIDPITNRSIVVVRRDSTGGYRRYLSTRASSFYAYAFVICGCNPDKPVYLNYIYNVLISSWILLYESYTIADIIVFIQLSYTTHHMMLPTEQERWFHELGIRFQYIPKHSKESFYMTQLNKFRIVGLQEYRRVIYLDADVLPLTNMDYLFTLSDRTTTMESNTIRSATATATDTDWLLPNAIIAGSAEPATGGFFMLQPYPDGLSDIGQIIRDKIRRSQKESDGFDLYHGWGHPIIQPDMWESNSKNGQNWTFHAAWADQGLLYYYTKYFLQNTSIVLADRVQHWEKGLDGHPVMVQEIKNPMAQYKKDSSSHYNITEKEADCRKWTHGKKCSPPYGDFKHFTGSGKPWYTGPPANLAEDGYSTPLRLWFTTLTRLNRRLTMGLGHKLRNWTTDWEANWPLLGLAPKKSHAKDLVVEFHNENK